MAISRTAHGATKTSATATTTSGAITVSALSGECIIVAVGTVATTSNAPTDNATGSSNTYVQLGNISTNTERITLWGCLSSKSAVTAITCTFGSSRYAVAIDTYTGVLGFNQSNINTSSGSASPATITLPNALASGCWAVAAFANKGTATWSANTGNLRNNVAGAGTTTPGVAIVDNTATTCAATESAGNVWAGTAFELQDHVDVSVSATGNALTASTKTPTVVGTDPYYIASSAQANDSSSGTTNTVSVTVAAGETVAALVTWFANTTLNSVTLLGQTFSLGAATPLAGNSQWTRLAYFINSTGGTGNLVATFGASCFSTIVLIRIGQASTLHGSATVHGQWSTNQSVALSAVSAGDFIAEFQCNGNGFTISPGATYTEAFKNGENTAAYKNAAGSSDTADFSFSSFSSYAIGALAFAASNGSATVTATGNAVTSAVGTTTESGSAAVSPSGSAASPSSGTATVSGNAATSLTGSSATVSRGTATVTGNATTSPVGSSASSSAGTLAAAGAASLAASGSQLSASVGSATATGTSPNVSVSVSGTAAVISSGTLSLTGNAVLSVTGSSVSGSPGTLSTTGTAIVSATGSSVGISGGSVSLVGTSTLAATGTALAVSAGSTTVDTSVVTTVNVSGSSLAVSNGTIGVVGSANLTASGSMSSATAGTIAVSIGANASVAASGSAVVLEVGSVTPAAGAQVNAIGSAVISSSGTLDLIGDASFELVSAALIASVGTVVAIGKVPYQPLPPIELTTPANTISLVGDEKIPNCDGNWASINLIGSED
jgi:hypothetical protein